MTTIADIRARHEWFASHEEGSREALDSAQMDRGMLLDCIRELEAAIIECNNARASEEQPTFDLIAAARGRIRELEAERDAYILKQKVWESANDELRSEHVHLRRRISKLEAALATANQRIAELDPINGYAILLAQDRGGEP